MTADHSEDSTRLGEMLPGLDGLDGAPTWDVVGGPVLKHLNDRESVSWEALASLSPKQIALLHNMGPIRTKRVLSNLRSLVGADLDRRTQTGPTERTGRSASDVEVQLLASVQELAAWATGNHVGGSVLDAVRAAIAADAADVPRRALDWLAATDAAGLVTEDQARRYDPVVAAEALIASFDERERAILDRVLDFDGSSPTLQELGERFEVSRERIRQIETTIRNRLDAALASADTRSLIAAADRLRERLGSAVPADLLIDEFAQIPPDLLDRLILHLAGPYRFDGDWYVLKSLGDFRTKIREAFDVVADEGIAPKDAFVDALEELGIRSDHVQRAIDGMDRLRPVEDVVVDWSRSLAVKAEIGLRLAGQPLTGEELMEFIQPNSERSFSSVVTSGRIVRVGVKRYGLAEWEMDEFPGIVPAMERRLTGGPVALDQLRSELVEEFSVSPNSVTIMAGTHPAFLVEDGLVMIRPEDRPYVPSSDLPATARCYLVDGVWSWRVPVDGDVLRGSGRIMPEAFAVHLGGAPLSKGSIQTPVGPISLGWGQSPGLGSLRSAARSLDAEEGDWVFVRRVRTSAVDFQLLRADDVPDAAKDPEGRLRALVGAAGSSEDLEQVLADALGLRGSVNHDLAEERAALEARRERDLVDLLDAADPQGTDSTAT